MQMYINEIKTTYPILYDRIIAQLKPEVTEETAQRLNVNTALIWSSTLEKGTFWQAVLQEKWDKAKELYPDYFINEEEDKKREFIVRENGLFK